MPSGRFFGSVEPRATSPIVRLLLVARLAEDAVLELDVARLDSSILAAMLVRLVDDLFGRRHAAPMPPTVAEREPPVPSPKRTSSVSPWT